MKFWYFICLGDGLHLCAAVYWNTQFVSVPLSGHPNSENVSGGFTFQHQMKTNMSQTTYIDKDKINQRTYHIDFLS